MHMPFDDAAFARYLSGESSPEEQLAIRRWLDADPARLARLETLRAAWDASGRRTAPSFHIEAMRHNLAVRTGGTRRISGPFKRVSHSRWLIPAASAAIAATLILIIKTTQEPRPEPTPLEQKEVATTRGQKADVYLSDATHVQLAPESRLRFTSPLADSARDVALEGRALFDVRHDSLRPFRVHTALGVAEDLGTRFDVRQYPGDTTLRVVVAEGVVALNADTLLAGDLGVLPRSGHVEIKRGVDVAREIGWSTGRLSFDAVPLRDAVRELRRFYDLEFVLADSVTAARRLTATFDTEAPSEVVRVIALSLELRAQTRGKTVTLRSR